MKSHRIRIWASIHEVAYCRETQEDNQKEKRELSTRTHLEAMQTVAQPMHVIVTQGGTQAAHLEEDGVPLAAPSGSHCSGCGCHPSSGGGVWIRTWILAGIWCECIEAGSLKSPVPGTSFPMGFTYPPVVSLVMIKGEVLEGFSLLDTQVPTESDLWYNLGHSVNMRLANAFFDTLHHFNCTFLLHLCWGVRWIRVKSSWSLEFRLQDSGKSGMGLWGSGGTWWMYWNNTPAKSWVSHISGLWKFRILGLVSGKMSGLHHNWDEWWTGGCRLSADGVQI